MEIEIKEFAYNNPSGGTNMSKGIFDIPFDGVAVVTLHSGFWDYETGWRYRGVAASEDLKKFISAHAHPTDNLVYFSEFDLADPSQKEEVAEEAKKIERAEFNAYLEQLSAAIIAQPANTAASFDGSVAVVFDGNVFYCAKSRDEVPEYDNLVDPDLSAWDSQWKKELDAWFAAPKFVSYTDDDRKRILSNFS